MACPMAICVQNNDMQRLAWQIPALKQSNNPSFHFPVGALRRGPLYSGGRGVMKIWPSRTPPSGTVQLKTLFGSLLTLASKVYPSASVAGAVTCTKIGSSSSWGVKGALPAESMVQEIQECKGARWFRLVCCDGGTVWYGGTTWCNDVQYDHRSSRPKNKYSYSVLHLAIIFWNSTKITHMRALADQWRISGNRQTTKNHEWNCKIRKTQPYTILLHMYICLYRGKTFSTYICR
jgi:hypothetical protein